MLYKSSLIQKLQEAGKVLGRMPTAKGMNSLKGFPSASAYQRHFGSWDNALEAAGYSLEERRAHVIVSEIKELTEGEAMYVAACIDTDGSISICGRNARKKGDTVQVSLANTHVGFLKHVQKMVGGGRLSPHNRKFIPSLKYPKECYTLGFRMNEVRDLLPQIIPFLVIKKDKAIRVLELLKSRKLPSAVVEDSEPIRTASQELDALFE